MTKAKYISIVVILSLYSPVLANGVGENYSWQYQTSADRATNAYIEEMRLKRVNGFYAPPVYNTTIDRQYNCNVTSSATGNAGTNTTQAAMPSTGGNGGSAIGNQSQKSTNLASSGVTSTATDSQYNRGEVESNVSGNVSSNVEDNQTSQVLNSNQQNGGTQTASVAGATACSFGVLN
jgi:hypothetical protein